MKNEIFDIEEVSETNPEDDKGFSFKGSPITPFEYQKEKRGEMACSVVIRRDSKDELSKEQISADLNPIAKSFKSPNELTNDCDFLKETLTFPTNFSFLEVGNKNEKVAVQKGEAKICDESLENSLVLDLSDVNIVGPIIDNNTVIIDNLKGISIEQSFAKKIKMSGIEVVNSVDRVNKRQAHDFFISDITIKRARLLTIQANACSVSIEFKRKKKLEIESNAGSVEIPKRVKEREVVIGLVEENYRKEENELVERKRKCIGNIDLKELRDNLGKVKEQCNKDKILSSLEEISLKLKEIDIRITKISATKEVQLSKQVVTYKPY
jgi:hypothetical protein